MGGIGGGIIKDETNTSIIGITKYGTICYIRLHAVVC